MFFKKQKQPMEPATVEAFNQIIALARVMGITPEKFFEANEQSQENTIYSGEMARLAATKLGDQDTLIAVTQALNALKNINKNR